MNTNFHTHTLYCDGQSTAEEMVTSAIENGMTALGFSGHSYTAFDDSYCMSKQNTKKYVDEINSLKQKYAGQIRIYCGIEQDYYAERQHFKPDFVIGSVHYVSKNGKYLPIDNNKEELSIFVKKYYKGDYLALAKDYYANVGDVVNRTNCDIIGHFDLVSKFNEGNILFNENDPRYIALMKKALDTLLESKKIFEINTGAIARGYRTMPYPCETALEYIAKNGGVVTITTDCHSKDKICAGVEEAEELVRRTGVSCVDFEDILKSKAE